ncbi:MAG TPA: efflux RND transporter periplasmic adaptor subunit [Flavisolibacter sp.]|jgi:membrane fusion protein, multidrug efflux system|nr:efflux RND transporter periplasmic adaptor subunit [Flavisolibacter sp.]
MRKNLIGLLFISVLLSACGSSSKDAKADLNDKKAELEKLKGEQTKINEKIVKLEEEIAKLDTNAAGNAKLVAITPIDTSAFEHYIEIQGTVEATNISYVAPPNGVGGVVKSLYVRQGQNVSKGQVLARLDDQLIRQQIEPIRVQLNAAQDTYKRMKNLYDQGIGTYQNVLNAKTQVETLQGNINTLQKQAALMTVTAPQSGVADLVNVRVGETFVGATAAGPQIRIVNTGDLKIKANIPENYQTKVAVGSALEVILPDQNNRVVNATVTVVSKIIDPVTRTFYIEAKVPASSNLKPNQVAKVHIKDYGNQNAITIPMSTLQNDETGKYVMLAVKEGDKLIARKRTVTVGELYNDKLEVKSGLQAGDQLITEGFQSLYDGQLITTQVK